MGGFTFGVVTLSTQIVPSFSSQKVLQITFEVEWNKLLMIEGSLKNVRSMSIKGLYHHNKSFRLTEIAIP